jgi:hypothetical protein
VFGREPWRVFGRESWREPWREPWRVFGRESWREPWRLFGRESWREPWREPWRKHCLQHCLTGVMRPTDAYFEACRVFDRELDRKFDVEP